MSIEKVLQRLFDMLLLLFQKQAGDKKEVMLRNMILTSLLFEMIGRVNCSS